MAAEAAVLEAPVDEVLEESTEPVSEEPIEATEEPAEEPAEELPEDTVEAEEEVAAVDGRKMPDSLKKGIAAIKATNPEAVKTIKQLYFADQEYRAVFPKPEDAVAAKSLIEQVGGTEGIQQIQEERQEWSELDQKYTEGSPEFVKTIADSSPEAFLKQAPHVINEFAQRAPEQYRYYANTVALNTLKSAGLTTDVLANAYKAYEGKPEAQGIIAEIHNALLGLKQQAQEFESRRTDPREEAIKQRESAFEQKRRADFEGNVASQAEQYLNQKMQPEIDRIINGRPVDPEAMQGYRDMVKAKVMKMLSETPGFEARLEANYRTGDAKKADEYIQSQYNRVLPTAAKVIEPFLRNIQATAKKVAPTGKPSGAGEIVLKEMPDWKDVDQSKTTVADLIQGHAVLKNGKKATGWA